MIINRDRKKKRMIHEGIEREEWKEYFMCLLGGRKEWLGWGGAKGKEVEKRRKR